MKYREDIKILGILGNPLKQSLSPLLHNYWIKKYKLNAIYLPLITNEIRCLDKTLKNFNFLGLNVTIPFKKEVLRYLDKVDKGAKKIKAVNTIVCKNKIIKGYNTDIFGFSAGIKTELEWNKKRPTIVFGAGGAAESVLCFLTNSNAKDIIVINRTKNRGEKISKKYKGVRHVKNIDNSLLKEAGLIVNTTSLGMLGYKELDIELKGINKEVIIYDIVYNPEMTGLIKKAKKEKLKTISGLSMFLEQAKKSFKLWFNIDPVIDNKFLIKLKKEIKGK